MRSFVRFSLIGLVALVAIGFVANQLKTNSDGDEVLPTVTPGVCEEQGISLIVDFGSANNEPLIEQCVQNYEGNSWDLFEAAELEVTGTEKYPVGFVCRIQNFPDNQSEQCKETPGTKNGSWAYFLTDENGSWKYSPIGASTHKTKCGQSEGWRYLLPGEPTNTFPRTSPKTYVCSS